MKVKTGKDCVFWQTVFWLLGHAAATMLWVNHGKGLVPLGATTPEFYREVRLELSRFIRRLDRKVQWTVCRTECLSGTVREIIQPTNS